MENELKSLGIKYTLHLNGKPPRKGTRARDDFRRPYLEFETQADYMLYKLVGKWKDTFSMGVKEE